MKNSELKKWTVRKLKAELKSLFSAIYQAECFGSRDLTLYDCIVEELKRRGYEITNDQTLSIDKA